METQEEPRFPMTNFEQALAKHGSAEEAIRHTLKDVYKYAHGNMTESFGPVAQWVLDNALAIHAHQTALQVKPNYTKRMLADIIALEERVQALEDAPGPRPNADEVSALRQRMDSLTDLVQKLMRLDKPWEDALARVERDVALLKDYLVIRHVPGVLPEEPREFRRTYIGTAPQTPEAPQAAGVVPATRGNARPEPVFNWVETACIVDGERWGEAGKTLDQWVGVVKGACQMFDTKAEARAWVEAQFNTPKNQ